MSILKAGEFALETEQGLFDLFQLKNDLKETEVLSILKNDLLREGKFQHPKPGKVCYSSIAAFIIYVSSICEILDTQLGDTESIH